MPRLANGEIFALDFNSDGQCHLRIPWQAARRLNEREKPDKLPLRIDPINKDIGALLGNSNNINYRAQKYIKNTGALGDLPGSRTASVDFRH